MTFRAICFGCAIACMIRLASPPALTQTIASPVVHISGDVTDQRGGLVPNADVTATGDAGTRSAHADAHGHYVLDYPSSRTPVVIAAKTRNMQSHPFPVDLSHSPNIINLSLLPLSRPEEITVTATRASIALPALSNTASLLDSRDLNNYPATALDDKLRQQAGFELFRRASSHIANPTSQGISLRGLGSTAVSRSLVLEESVPLNDPFGGWIHWDEIPEDVIQSVDIATGGGSDLYGSSALGGVVDIIPEHPSTARLDISGFGGGQDTSLGTLRTDLGSRKWRQLAAGEIYRTAGYIPTSPSLAGPVDIPADVHYQNLRTESDRVDGHRSRAFLTGNLLNEARSNGTRLQTNGTRLWRYILGGDWAKSSTMSGRARVFGSDEAYRQTFSAINSVRTTEFLTRTQQVRTQELGASTDASASYPAITFVAGADVRDIRATDNETPIKAGLPSGISDTSARQRFIGGFGELLGSHGKWSGALSLRLDGAWNLDTRSITEPTSLPQPSLTPNRGEFIASPRLGLVRQLTSKTSLHASAFRAFRTPSMNELYRTGQVGQEITQANAELQSERATGWEAGAEYDRPAGTINIQGTYFWTEINRPVSAVILSTTPTSILERRENLGQIISQGAELHANIRPRKAISATLGYQYAHALVTRFSAEPSLVGNWIPQVPRQSFAGQLRAQHANWGELTLATRASGRAYDDSGNTFVLRRFVQLDIYAKHDFGSNWTASASIQNLLNQRPDVARTPILTLGSPLLAQGGLAFHWGDASSH